MKDAGVNMIRTGIWTGWKNYMTAAGKLNDAMLRAFDAFLLTAHKYDISGHLPHNFAFTTSHIMWVAKMRYLDPVD